MGRSGGRFVQRARRPIGKPYWSPTHGALGTEVHDAFPPFPPTKKKKKLVARAPGQMWSGLRSTKIQPGYTAVSQARKVQNPDRFRMEVRDI